MFKGPQETVRDNKSSSHPVFELPGVNCFVKNVLFLQLVNVEVFLLLAYSTFCFSCCDMGNISFFVAGLLFFYFAVNDSVYTKRIPKIVCSFK